MPIYCLVFIIGAVLGTASYAKQEFAGFLRFVWGWQLVREIKFLAAIYFSATIILHVYLSVTEDISRLQAMITGYERRSQSQVAKNQKKINFRII